MHAFCYYVCLYKYNKVKRIQQTLKFIHYSSITTNSFIQLKVKKCLEKPFIGSSSSEVTRKKKRAEETEDIQQPRLLANRIQTAAGREQKARWLANSNRNAAARPLESVEIRQARFLTNRIQTAAGREQNTQERQH